MLQPIIGDHPSIVRLRRQLPEWAARDEPLVIFGESGVGKTLLAEHIHALSPMKSHPLRTVNLRLLNDRDRRLQLLGGDSPELATRRRSVLSSRTTVVIKHVDCRRRVFAGYTRIHSGIARKFRTRDPGTPGQALPVVSSLAIISRGAASGTYPVGPLIRRDKELSQSSIAATPEPGG